MDLDQDLSVLCFCEPGVLKGLGFTQDQGGGGAQRYKFFPASLAQIGQLRAEQFDMVLLALDIGQPVPIEHLRKLPQKPGLVLFVQPTPQQLLALGELAQWMPYNWDGASFERALRALDRVAERFQRELEFREFVETCQAWAQQSSQMPALVEFVNPPESWTASTLLRLDQQNPILLVGQSQSRADLLLSSVGTQELGEFRFVGGQWTYRSRGRGGAPQALKAGMQVEESGAILHLRADPKLEEFTKIARRFNFMNEAQLDTAGGNQTLADICKQLLYAGITGELRVSSELRKGHLYFSDGVLSDAVAGAVQGRKAVMRMFGWDAPQWTFMPGKRSMRKHERMGITVVMFEQMHKHWRERWNTVKGLMPPAALRLRAVASKFNERAAWTAPEAQVLAGICEFQLVRDVLNACAMPDVEVVETLVQLRRQGIIEPYIPATRG